VSTANIVMNAYKVATLGPIEEQIYCNDAMSGANSQSDIDPS